MSRYNIYDTYDRESELIGTVTNCLDAYDIIRARVEDTMGECAFSIAPATPADTDTDFAYYLNRTIGRACGDAFEDEIDFSDDDFSEDDDPEWFE